MSLAEVLAFVRNLDSRLLLEEGRDGAKEDRYSRQRLFYGAWRSRGRPFAQEAQTRLASSRVFLFGVGGGGCHVLQNLASFGLGGITAVDGDVVAPSNLNRQCLYRPDDVGRSKIDVLRRELPRINGDVAFSFVDRVMRGPEDFASLIADADLAILTADSPRQSIFGWFDDALFPVFRPGLFTAGVSLGGLSLGPLVVPGETACYCCSLPPWTPDFSRPEVAALNTRYCHGVIAPQLSLNGLGMPRSGWRGVTAALKGRYRMILLRFTARWVGAFPDRGLAEAAPGGGLFGIAHLSSAGGDVAAGFFRRPPLRRGHDLPLPRPSGGVRPKRRRFSRPG